MKTNYIEKQTNFGLPDPLEDILNIPRSIVAIAREYPAGHLALFHQHARAQFLYASSGVMTVTTDVGIWAVPPHRAVWIPALTRHQIKVTGHFSMRSIYIDPSVVSNAPTGCCVVAVSPLLKELILHAVEIPDLYPIGGPEERIMLVILDQIRHLRKTPLELPIPEDVRLKRIYDALAANPADNRTLDDWGNLVGATSRTLSRHFRSETGMTFSRWRQRVRVLEALKRLELKEAVTAVAYDLGYESPSAFISMFKKVLGKTPGQYLNRSGPEDDNV